MSRTNPYKKKRRSAKQTLLMFGEGLGEEMFLKHLRGLYAKNSGVSVMIRKGKGGTPKNIVIDAANEFGDFHRRVVILDNDRGEQQMREARTEAGKRNIQLVEHTPCLEALLLEIIRNGQEFQGKTSAWCKREFETNYIEKKKRGETREYEKIFPKSLLDQARTGTQALERIIAFMESPQS